MRRTIALSGLILPPFMGFSLGIVVINEGRLPFSPLIWSAVLLLLVFGAIVSATQALGTIRSSGLDADRRAVWRKLIIRGFPTGSSGWFALSGHDPELCRRHLVVTARSFLALTSLSALGALIGYMRVVLHGPRSMPSVLDDVSLYCIGVLFGAAMLVRTTALLAYAYDLRVSKVSVDVAERLVPPGGVLRYLLSGRK